METQIVSLQRLGYSFAEAELVSGISRATLYGQVARGALRWSVAAR